MARGGQRQSGGRRPAPRNRRRSPRRRQRGHHPGPRPRRARGRVGRRARLRAALGADQVPGRRPPGPRGAGPGEGGRHERRRAPERRAQAAGRRRHHPRQDRCPRHLPVRPPGRGRRRLRRGEGAQAGHAEGGRHRAASRGTRAGGPRRRAHRQRASGRSAVGGRPSAREPVPDPGLLRHRATPVRPPPPGHLGASRPALPRVRVRREVVEHAAPRADLAAGAGRPGADAAPGSADRLLPPPDIGPSCSPTSPASARPRRRCWPRRPPTRSRCSWSCRTSSR